MSEKYIPLYRKYRPQSFLDLVGQEKIAKALSNAINLDKIAHAYLFCGPRGTGKTSSARILAKSLNCVEGPTITPCGKCPSCVDITNSTPVDVIEIDAASNRSVEDAQNILEKIQYVPIHGKYKIYIIDEVHMLSNTAFNALLKTLEEPPENVIFILATTEVHKVLETIISRCQRFDFRRITVQDIVERLKYISEKENINISDNALLTIAKSAQGGLRDALALLDQLSILDVEKQIDVEDVENLLGKISVEKLFNLTETIISKNPSDAILTTNEIYDKGNEPLQIITNLIEYFRNLLIIKNCAEKETVLELTQLNIETIKKLSEQAQELSNEKINYVIDRLAYYLREIKNAADRHLWLEVGIIELCNNLSNVNFSDILSRLERLESGKIQLTPPARNTDTSPRHAEALAEASHDIRDSSPAPPMAGTGAQNDNEESAQNDSGGVDMTLWQAILTNIQSVPTRMFFSSLSKPVKVTQTGVVIGFTKESFVKQAKEEPRSGHLQTAVQAVLGDNGNEIVIKLVEEDSVAQSNRHPEASADASHDVRDSSPAPPIAGTGAQNENPRHAEFISASHKRDAETCETLKPVQGDTEINDDEEYYEKQLEEIKSPQAQRKDFSDQANMIMELFSGKYME